jgi:hypothetical protein
MAAWGSSPYRAVGVYIGGANMACAQPNLTPGWVSQESVVGWHLIPIYVGLQAPTNSCGCAAISGGRASSQGQAAARDAINRAQALGMGPGNPIYFDMEAYPRGGGNSSAVLSFLAGWTAQLHAAGYESGVYSSIDSGISDLVSQAGVGYSEPDDLWFANWNGVRSVDDGAVPSGEWPNHQRLHQYQGGHDETHGGVTINIDGNYLDAATAAAGSTASAASEPAASSPPAIYGKTVEGQTLSEAHGTWPGAPASYVYQWQDCNKAGFNCMTISGATAASYALSPSDVGHTIRVIEIASYAGGVGIPATSNPTSQVLGTTPLYWLYSASGTVYGSVGTSLFGSPWGAGFRGSPVTGMAPTPDGQGYWLTSAAGTVFAFGDAASLPAPQHRHPIRGIVAAPGGGYWVYTAYGNVYATSGTALYGSPAGGGFRGSTIVGMAATADGGGYWLVSATGRVFAYGDAASLPAVRHRHPIRGIVAAPGGGYWLYTAYGNVLGTSGTAFYGSPSASRIRTSSIAGMAPSADRQGYWLVTSAGTVFAYGDAARLPAAGRAHRIEGITGS